MKKLRSLHLKVAKRILCFVKGTTSYGLYYSSSYSLEITGYNDSGWGGILKDRKNTTEFVFFM
jgi:hypothetical protein